MLPVRCYTCNKVLGHLDQALERSKENLPELFRLYRIERYCCRRILLAHVADPNLSSPAQLPATVQELGEGDSSNEVPETKRFLFAR